MEFSVSQNLIDDPEIVHHFEAAWLKALTLRTDKVRLRLIYNPELHTRRARSHANANPVGPAPAIRI
jgi:hypothetical protein